MIRLVGTDRDVVLSVENNGPTISPANVEVLFQPLQRDSHGDAENERTSLGLGLFIVRHIVKAHGGTVTLTSVNRRTACTIALPRNLPP